MLSIFKSPFAARRDHADCSGCGLCLLVCPVWRQSRDVSLTPLGFFKAMQHGAGAAGGAATVEHCTLCMACEPVCPERIDITGVILGVRHEFGEYGWLRDVQTETSEKTCVPAAPPSSSTVLLPDRALLAHPGTLARIIRLLGGEGAIAVGSDSPEISLMLEAGATIAGQRLEQFLSPLRKVKKIIVADGLLLRRLKLWLPHASITSVGEVLSGHAGVRRGLRATDLYVIEPRAYHSDYQRLVKHYDRLRVAHGCAFNLDLHRIAIPATARSLPQRLGRAVANDEDQARWVLHGRNVSRIVVENLEERAALEKVGGLPVVHLADLADDGVQA